MHLHISAPELNGTALCGEKLFTVTPDKFYGPCRTCIRLYDESMQVEKRPFRVTETSTFDCKSEEQAGYIRELYENLHALIICENSKFEYKVEPIRKTFECDWDRCSGEHPTPDNYCSMQRRYGVEGSWMDAGTDTEH